MFPYIMYRWQHYSEISEADMQEMYWESETYKENEMDNFHMGTQVS